MGYGRRMRINVIAPPWYTIVDDGVHLVAISRAQRAQSPDVRCAAVIPNRIKIDRYPVREEKEELPAVRGPGQPREGSRARRGRRPPGGPAAGVVVKRAEQTEKDYWDEVVAPRMTGDEEVLEGVGHDQKVDLMGRAAALVAPVQ